ncbi:MAG: hypothetical protein KAU17_11630 [Spirochaetales bacterium]|nr:hypothetical protein [Spirochaetales bacterium]
MEAMVEILEQELEGAFEVKDRKSLHRYILLLTENLVRKESYEKEQYEIKSDIKILAELVKQGFERMDKRFEAMQIHMDKRFEAMQINMDKRFEDMQIQMDKRFEAVDKRFEAVDRRFEAVDKRFEDVNSRFDDMSKKFTMMFAFMNIGLGILIAVTIIFKFIG